MGTVGGGNSIGKAGKSSVQEHSGSSEHTGLLARSEELAVQWGRWKSALELAGLRLRSVDFA